MKLTLASSILLATLLTGCQTSHAEPVSARLINPSAASKLELQQYIQQAIGGEPVKLADNVFTDSSILYIEQAILRDERGLPIMGRHQQPVETFELLQHNNRCFLQYRKTGERLLLKQVQCTAEPTQ